MKDALLTQRQRRDLYSLYLKGLREGRFSSVRDAASWLCRQPAPCFYISPERATLLVGRIMNNRSLSDLHSSTQRMAWKLYHDYRAWVLSHPGKKHSRVNVMNELIEHPAPEFYMSHDAIRKALRIEIQAAKRKMGWLD